MAVIPGTPGPDILQGTADDDLIEGFEGDDYLQGGKGRDELYGGDGNDVLNGSNSDSETDLILSGGDGDDVLRFDGAGLKVGEDVPITLVDGGSGVDTVQIQSSLPLSIDLSDPANPHTFYGLINVPLEPFYGITLVNVERLEYRSSASFGVEVTGGAYDDNIAGGRADDILRGGGGNDSLSGGDGGRDTMFGGNGDDTLSMDSGDLLVDGGDGIDGLFFAGYYPSDPTIIFSLADPSLEQTVLGATVRNVEYIRAYSYGSRGNDVVTGGAYADTFNGFEGDDIIHGGGGDDELGGDIEALGNAGDDQIWGDAGSDIITGDGGDDLLYGGTQEDRLFGGTGDDVLTGGEGADVLSGGSGADTFVFAPGDVGLAYADRDKIVDFEVGIDLIDLSAFAGATVTLVHGAGYDRVKIDFDGDLRTDALLQVETVGGAALTMDDIIL